MYFVDPPLLRRFFFLYAMSKIKPTNGNPKIVLMFVNPAVLSTQIKYLTFQAATRIWYETNPTCCCPLPSQRGHVRSALNGAYCVLQRRVKKNSKET